MFRVALGIEYDGSAYCGWQLQDHSPSVQEDLEKALKLIANEDIRVHCAGRTDTGVHALEQIVHFETSVEREAKNWIHGVNTKLPSTVNVHWAKAVPDDFHARFSAHARRYQYVILNRPTRSALMAQRVNWYKYSLDAELMNQAAQYLLGSHDFTSFRASGCQAQRPVREIQAISVKRLGDLVVLDIKANAFLQHMVRNIVGTLLKVGNKKRPVEWVAEVLEEKDRTVAGMAADANGLYFIRAFYPEQFELPSSGREVSELLLT